MATSQNVKYALPQQAKTEHFNDGPGGADQKGAHGWRLEVIHTEFSIDLFHPPVVPPDDYQEDDERALGRHVKTQRKAEEQELIDLSGEPGNTEGQAEPASEKNKGQPSGPTPVGISVYRHDAVSLRKRMAFRKLVEPGSGLVRKLTTMIVASPAITPKKPLEVAWMWNHGSM